MPKKTRTSQSPGSEGENVPVGSHEEIRRRLILFVKTTFDNWSVMEQAAHIPHPTAVAWKRRGGPLPSTENLMTLARLGLSLDWLATGSGPMQLHPFSLGRGALLESLRPFLQRRSAVGDHTASQAFAAMILRLGEERALEKASDGLAGEFEIDVARLAQFHRYGELVGWVWEQLRVIEAGGIPNEAGPPNAALEALRTRLFDYLPDDFRPGALLHDEFWAAIAVGRTEFVRAVRKQIDDQTST